MRHKPVDGGWRPGRRGWSPARVAVRPAPITGRRAEVVGATRRCRHAGPDRDQGVPAPGAGAGRRRGTWSSRDGRERASAAVWGLVTVWVRRNRSRRGRWPGSRGGPGVRGAVDRGGGRWTTRPVRLVGPRSRRLAAGFGAGVGGSRSPDAESGRRARSRGPVAGSGRGVRSRGRAPGDGRGAAPTRPGAGRGRGRAGATPWV